MQIRARAVAGAGLFAMAIGLSSCGMPGPPQPPSLKLPKIVEDLAGQRTGPQVLLRWTGPSENTDKTKVEAGATAVVCRKSSPQGSCEKVGSLPNRPGMAMEYADTLPADLQAGDPRVMAYEVATENKHQRSAGWSLAVPVPAGEPAQDVVNLTATNTPRGVQLAWKTAGPSGGDITYRIFRTRLSSGKALAGEKAASDKQAGKKTSFAGEEEPADQTLEVVAAADTALDTHTAWQQQYSYRVQAVKKVRIETERGLLRFELAGMMSNVATVETKDVFPPAAPRGLAVVPVWGDDDKPGMDLNWEPNTEARLAGYRVYRAVDAGSGFGADELISGGDLLTAPAFSDRGLIAGAKYQYWIVAVDAAGNASSRSAGDTEVALRSRE